jgi:perosamine synthetase
MEDSDWKPEAQLGVGHLEISALGKKYVNQVLDSNRLSYGPMSRELEEQFARIHSSRHAIFLNSGTSALHVALAALKEKYDWKAGDEVIVPAITFVATINMVLEVGLHPVLVDVDANTYNIDISKIEAAISPRTRAIMPVHLCGLPAQMQAILDISKRHHLRVVEDACETMFVSVDDRPVGSHGDVGCFSTYVAHLLVTGVGGMAITSDDDLAVIMRSLGNHGRDGIYLSIDDDRDRSQQELHTVMERRFRFDRVGYSYRNTEIEAALGIAEMSCRDDMMAARRSNAETLTSRLSHLAEKGILQLPSGSNSDAHAYQMYPIVLSEKYSRDYLTFFLEDQRIETRPLLPITNQPVYQRLLGDLQAQYPVADRLNRQAFYIGCHQGFKQREINYIASKICEFFRASSP